MPTTDPQTAAELRFDLPTFEPGTVLLEQLSMLATAPTTGARLGRRFSRRAVAGFFAGLVLASSTAYAARDQIVPTFDSIIGHGQHHTTVVPRPHVSPGPSVPGNASSGGTQPSLGSGGTSGDSKQSGDSSGSTGGGQSGSGSGDG